MFLNNFYISSQNADYTCMCRDIRCPTVPGMSCVVVVVEMPVVVGSFLLPLSCRKSSSNRGFSFPFPPRFPRTLPPFRYFCSGCSILLFFFFVISPSNWERFRYPSFQAPVTTPSSSPPPSSSSSSSLSSSSFHFLLSFIVVSLGLFCLWVRDPLTRGVSKVRSPFRYGPVLSG